MSEPGTRPEITFVARSHETLHDMIARFCAALRHHKGLAHLNNLRDDFKAVLNSHLEFENYLMASNNYPLTYAHVEAHGLLKVQVDQILDDAVRQGTDQGVDAAISSVYDRHAEYYDDILCRFLDDKYHLQAVVDGLGI